MSAIDDGLALFKFRAQFFAAEAAAVLDDSTRPLRVYKWVAAKFGLPARAISVKRYPASAAPGLNGFIWRGQPTLYLSTSAGLRTEIHECLHLLTDLPEVEIRALASRLAAEANEPVIPTTREETIDVVDWVY
jgi:hypothetical protein